jgi:hypothetical protein
MQLSAVNIVKPTNHFTERKNEVVHKKPSTFFLLCSNNSILVPILFHYTKHRIHHETRTTYRDSRERY